MNAQRMGLVKIVKILDDGIHIEKALKTKTLRIKWEKISAISKSNEIKDFKVSADKTEEIIFTNTQINGTGSAGGDSSNSGSGSDSENGDESNLGSELDSENEDELNSGDESDSDNVDSLKPENGLGLGNLNDSNLEIDEDSKSDTYSPKTSDTSIIGYAIGGVVSIGVLVRVNRRRKNK